MKIVLKGNSGRIVLRQVGQRGPQGEPGEGVPTGGTTGEVLTKLSNADFDTEWAPVPSAPVDSVNGQTGVVVLDAADVGADTAGSAAQALIDANDYTDTAVAGVDTGVMTVVAGDNVTVDDTDPANPIVSAADAPAPPVTSVNGQTGAVVLNAGDVGADVAGSAAQALVDANNYTDNEIAGVDTGVMNIVAGDNVTVDSTDPANPVVSADDAPATTWGSITGTLSDQTDLQNALDAKYDSSNPDGYINGVDWGDITGTLSDQTDLQAALDDKADSSDLGDYLPLAGGTLSRSLAGSSGVESILEVNPTINQSGSAGYNALVVNATETSTGSGGKYLLRAQVAGSDRLTVFNDGRLRVTAENAGSSFVFEASGYATVGSADLTTFLTRNTAPADTDNLVRYRAALQTASGTTNAYELSGGFTNITAGNQHTLLELKAVNSGSFTNVLSFNGVLGTLYGNLSMNSNQITSLDDATAADHAVNLSQLDGRLSEAQRTAIDALDGSSTVTDIVNALQA